MSSRNGYIRKALELGRQFSPGDVEVLRLGRAEVLLGLATDKERPAVAVAVESWEEQPEVTRLLNPIALRVEHPEDRQVLTRAEPFRRFLPEAMPDVQPDAEVEKAILDQAARKAAAQTANDACQRLYIAALVAGRKLDQASDAAKAQRVRAASLQQDYQAARDQLDREQGRLSQLLQLRAERKRRLLLIEATK